MRTFSVSEHVAQARQKGANRSYLPKLLNGVFIEPSDLRCKRLLSTHAHQYATNEIGEEREIPEVKPDEQIPGYALWKDPRNNSTNQEQPAQRPAIVPCQNYRREKTSEVDQRKRQEQNCSWLRHHDQRLRSQHNQ